MSAGLLKRRLRNTARFDADGYRRVNLRGDIDLALAAEDGRSRDVREGPTASRLERIAPETPRPVEMLEHVAVQGDDHLTAGDLALHELLVAYAYQKSERRMDRLGYAMPTSYALRFLGDGARRKGLRESLSRLRSTTVSFGIAGGRRFEDVPLLAAWLESEGSTDEMRYVIPEPIQALMASQPRYAYLELAALAKMKSRYGIRLYRHLAFAMREAVWVKGLDNLHTVTVSVGDLRAWLGWDGDHIGQLQLRGLKPALADLAHVRLFALASWEPIKGRRRGGGIDGWTISLRLNPPRAHDGRMQGVSRSMRSVVGGIDAPRFRIRQDTWQRKGRFVLEHGFHGGFADAFHAWLVAIDEALTARPVTEGHATRGLRGQRLLDAIDRLGPEQAMSDFLAEEVESPDLLLWPEDPAERKERWYREYEARTARYHRWQDYKRGKSRQRQLPASPSPKAAADVARNAAPTSKDAPAPEATGPLAWVEFLIDAAVPTEEVDAIHEAIMEMSFEGMGFDGLAPVEATIRFHTGLGTDTMALGDLPLLDRDVAYIAKAFDRIIEKTTIGRKEA